MVSYVARNMEIMLIDGQHKMEGSPEKDGTLNQLCDHRWPT